jgi:DNA-binding beta-propeller fold protein YncE
MRGPRSRARGRRAARLTAAAVGAGLGLLVWSVPSWALIARGHVLATRFEGAGEHALVAPGGVAVDEATGEVFVADRSAPHEQVERFRPNGAGGYEFVSAFDVKSPAEIAVDNSRSGADPSRGDVYVVGAGEEGAVGEGHDVLYKYSPESDSVLYRKTVFHGKGGEELELEDIDGVAVDADGTVWVDWGEEGVVSGLSDAESNRWQPSQTRELALEEKVVCRASPGFAVAPNDEFFYVAHERESPVEECSEEEAAPATVARFTDDGELVDASLTNGEVSGVAVDPVSGEAYADDVASVAAFSSSGAFVQRFGTGELNGGGAVAVDHSRELVYALEPGVGRVAVFGSEAAGRPVIDGVHAESLSSGSERVVAEIDPKGATTSYYLQYGTANCATEEAACTDEPLPPGTVVGSGFGDQAAVEELTGLQANSTYHYRVLAENQYGSVASAQSADTFFTTLPSARGTLADDREWELVSPSEPHGATAEPISREGALIQASSAGDGLAWTASAPVGGAPVGNRRPEPAQVLSTRIPGVGWSSQDLTTPHDKGEGVTPGAATEYRFFSSDLGFSMLEPQVPNERVENPPLAPGATEKTIYQRNDGDGEFTPLVTPADDTAGTAFGGKLEFAGATPDLSHAVFASEVPLLEGAGQRGLYEWRAGSQLKLVSVLPGGTPASEPALGDEGRDVRGAISSDGSRVFWTNGASDEGPLFMTDTTTGQTFQLNAAQGVREAGEEEIEERLDEVRFEGASSDGERVFFTDTWPLTGESNLEPLAQEEEVSEPPAGGHSLGRPADLYEYDVGTGRLVDLTPGRVGERADVLGTIAGISEDGAHVYFVANGVLAPGAAPGDCPRTKPLLRHPEDQCNLYVSEFDPEDPEQRQVTLIARLSDEDAPDWGGGNSPLPGDLGGLTAQVSSNGRYLAFMSERELTGYGNVDANPQADGAHDEEVFLYDNENGRLVCASCNPSGEPPHGVFDTEEAGEGVGLVVDRPETWSGHWLAGSVPGWTLFELTNPTAEHQSRYLSNSGRLFFNSADPLLPQVSARERQETIAGQASSVGVENVYEFEPEGEGTCQTGPGCVALVSSGTSDQESAFLDASESGDDAFFLTAAQLVPEDTEDNPAIYDARVCNTGESEPCLPPKPPPQAVCSGEGCRPAFSGQQPPAPPATSTLTEPASNPGHSVLSTSTKATPKAKPPTRAQLLAKALKACAKIRQKHTRIRCQARARKKYGKPARKHGSSRKRSERTPNKRSARARAKR